MRVAGRSSSRVSSRTSGSESCIIWQCASGKVINTSHHLGPCQGRSADARVEGGRAGGRAWERGTFWYLLIWISISTTRASVARWSYLVTPPNTPAQAPSPAPKACSGLTAAWKVRRGHLGGATPNQCVRQGGRHIYIYIPGPAWTRGRCRHPWPAPLRAAFAAGCCPLRPRRSRSVMARTADPIRAKDGNPSHPPRHQWNAHARTHPLTNTTRAGGL